MAAGQPDGREVESAQALSDAPTQPEPLPSPEQVLLAKWTEINRGRDKLRAGADQLEPLLHDSDALQHAERMRLGQILTICRMVDDCVGELQFEGTDVPRRDSAAVTRVRELTRTASRPLGEPGRHDWLLAGTVALGRATVFLIDADETGPTLGLTCRAPDAGRTDPGGRGVESAGGSRLAKRTSCCGWEGHSPLFAPSRSVLRGDMSVTAPRAPSQPGAGAARPVQRRWLALLVLCVSLLIVTLDNTILNVALPTLVRDLNATSSQLQWIVDSYAMVFAGLMLVAGSLGDRFGRKRVFLVGLASFGGASAWAAFSGSVGILIAARAGMGVGAAMMMPSTLSIITDMFQEPAQRQRAIGMWAATSGLGIAIGPMAGGVLLAHFWWGSIFLVNVPIAVVGLLCAVALVPESRNPRAARSDPIGGVLSIAGLGLLLWAIIEAPTHGWTSFTVIGAGTAALLVLAGFAAWEHAIDHPMLNLAFFRNRRFSVASASMSVAMFAMMGTLFVMTQLLQFGFGYSAIEAGVRILPAAAVLAITAPASTLVIHRFGTKLTVGVGLLTVSAGLWQLSLASVSSTYVDVVAGMVLLGLGAGLVMPAVTASIMGTLPRGQTGIGAATNGVSVQVGGALGVAVIGSLLSTRYQNLMTDRLSSYRLPHSVMDTVLGSIGGALRAAAQVGGAPGAALSQWAHSSFISGMDLGLSVAAVAAATAAVLAFAALPARPTAEQQPDTPAAQKNTSAH